MADSTDMKNEDEALSYDDAVEPSHGGIDWQEVGHAIRERLWIVLLLLVLGSIGAAVYLSRQERAFMARSVLFIEQEQSKVLDPTKVQGLREDTILSLDMINTVVDLLRSFPFAERVATRLKLHKDPRFLAALPEKPTAEFSPSEAAANLLGKVQVAYRTRTRLIDIFVTLRDPALAADVANAYADEYIRYGFDRKAEANNAARQYLIEESERLNRELRVAEEAMQSFRERERTVSLDDAQLATQTKMTELSKNIGEIDNRVLQLDNDLQVVAVRPGDAESLLRLPSVAAQPKVVELNQQIADLDRQFTLLKQRYRARHPSYIAAQTQLASLTRDRNQVLQDVVGLLRGQRQQMQTQREEMSKLRDAQQSQLLTTTGKSVEYNNLKRTVDTDKVLYESVRNRIAQLDVTKTMTESPVRVHERANGASPVQVSTVKIYVLGVVGGLALGLGIALGLHFMDRSIKTIDQAERLGGVAVLAAVPRVRRKTDDQLDTFSDREGIIAESFRTLRTSVALGVKGDTRRVFMFTSAVPSEGKTFCSSNFAVTLSQQGYRTLLIDADLRRPSISKVFFGEHRQPGLMEIMLGQTTLSEAVLDTKVDDLKILTAGQRAPNPAEWLASAALQNLIYEACHTFDRIVIDTAPVLAVSDALLIAPQVDVTCLVLRSFKTPRKAFTRAIKALADIDRRPTGLVFNFMPTGFGSYYYYSGKYHGSYGTKGVYGT